MNTMTTSIQATRLSKLLALCVFLTVLSLSTSAQSDQATPNPNTEIYKLVLPMNNEYGSSKGGQKERELRRLESQMSFVRELNKVGSQGYRAILTHGLFAIVKLDSAQYAYIGYEHEGGRVSESGFNFRYSQYAKRTFALREYSWIINKCETIYQSSPEPSMYSCRYLSWVLLEGVKGQVQPVPFILASNSPTSGKDKVQAETAAAALTVQVRDAHAKGYQVTHLFSKFELFLQKTNQSDFPLNESEIQVINDGGSENKMEALKTKINSLAQQGYRLMSLGYDIAVMYRPKGTTLPVSYVWLNVIAKNAELELAQLKSKGAVYRMIHPDEDDNRALMVFEQSGNSTATQREYKLLKMELESVEKKAEKKVAIELTPETKDVMKTVNQLAQEGFIVRDELDGGYKIEGKRFIDVTYILMERSR
jgi:hypothetical protein